MMNNDKAYEKIVKAFKSRKKGATVADITAATGLPLNSVRSLVPKAADEYRGRLQVTESGEILYSFPVGFTSRYKGLVPFIKKTAGNLVHGTVAAGTFLFKIWIMVMLVGYFLLFMAIAVASLFLSAAASSSNNRSRRGGNLNFSVGIFHLIIRLWFYSELTGPSNQNRRRSVSRANKRPLHKAIFSFVFGDPDPNLQWQENEKKAFIAFLRENRGVISLPELMILGGYTSMEAEQKITAFCVEFGGSPEATEDGTVVYRFEEILMGSETGGKANLNDRAKRTNGDLPLLFKSPITFSSNPGKMNWWFSVINAVNLVFGSYFLYNAASVGNILTEHTSRIYLYVYAFLYQYAAINNPLPLITIALGIIPLVFSALFWLIPALRNRFIKNKNSKIRFENFRKFAFSKIWNSPLNVKAEDLNPVYKEAGPDDLQNSRDKALKEMGSYSVPEVTIENNSELFSFNELEREKQALSRYRSEIDPQSGSLGKTIFDSGQ